MIENNLELHYNNELMNRNYIFHCARGNKTAIRQKSKTQELASENATEEPLDLADLDLSRLRLSKKDLETLSSIAPGLPKCFQEQLLAKLPPTQARKLSRTLSMQNEPPPSVPVYKRSQSSGRSMSSGKCATDEQSTTTTGGASSSRTSDESSGERSFVRRSVSRTRPDYETAIPAPLDLNAIKSRSSSVCREDCNKSLCAPYASDISEKYKYYSPYLMKPMPKEVPANDASASTKRFSDTNAVASLARPPSGYNNATNLDVANNGSLRRRSSQRRISRFLRPDFFEEPLEENAYLREKKCRERETQHVLREIREKSREPSRDRLNTLEVADANNAKETARHVRNKSLELYTEAQTNGALEAEHAAKHQIRSLSRPREIIANIDKNELADKILQELQLLSAVRNQQEQHTVANCPADCVKNNLSNGGFELRAEKTATIKKVKKIKAKDKITDDAGKVSNNAGVGTLKKVKKVVKKTEDINGAAVMLEETDASKKESKLKRPKSYPMKELVAPTVNKQDTIYSNMATKVSAKLPNSIPECESCEQMSTALPIPLSLTNTAMRESRLVRPKSYPATKLAPPQAVKKITHIGMDAINSQTVTPKSSSVSRQNTSEEKCLSLTPTGKGSGGDNSSSSDSRTQAVKKVMKITKKSKLIPPTALTPSAEELKERVSPEKKPKGLLYVIGQKFEKLRDSAMNKDKKTSGNSVTSASSSSATCLTANKSSSSSEHSSPEKNKQKTNILRKKKSLTDTLTLKTEKSNNINETINSNSCANKTKTDKRSRIDAVWRTLRERSVPRVVTHNNDANLLKRAISVEEMRASSNRTAVNKVLGLFRRNDKDANERRVRSAHSASNLERKMLESPESPIYQNTSAIEALAKSQRKSKSKENYCGDSSCSCGDSKPATPSNNQKLQHLTCPDCIQDEVSKNRAEEITKVATQFKEAAMTGNKDKRKGLMLELNKIDNSKFTTKNNYAQYNGLYSNLPPYPGVHKSSSNNSSSQHSMDNTATTRTTNNVSSSLSNNNNNNNSLLQNSSHTSGYHSSSTHEINRNNLLTPSSENIANYSSDSRSYQDDCVSNSTFLSPTDEPELCFDNWSVCSEDNYMRHMTPSPTVSRLSRASQRSSPTRTGDNSDPNESVIDRIKRRSFYCRFNDKKPRRTSSIVGPNATRDYYREQQAAIKARSNNKINIERTERNVSPDITHEFFRPLKLSPVGTELKPPIYRSPLEYAISSGSATNRPRKSLNDIRPLITPINSSSSTTPSYSSRRYTTNCERDNDYLSSITSGTRYRTPATNANMYDAAGMMGSNSSYYSTYNPKRRSSYTLNGSLPNGNAHIDGYATVGRRAVRPYDQRTLSLHDAPTSTSSNSSTFRRDARTPIRDYSSGISRSNSRYRNTPTPRSPTNI